MQFFQQRPPGEQIVRIMDRVNDCGTETTSEDATQSG